LGHPEWLDDPRFETNGLRVENKPALIEAISSETVGLTKAELAEKLDAAGVPNAPVHTMAEVLAHPQTHALDILRGADPVQAFALPLTVDGLRPGGDEGAPALGADNDWLGEVLGETSRQD
jgi:formyl-CoA transferase